MRRRLIGTVLFALVAGAGCAPRDAPGRALVIGICDPLARETASDCIRPSAVREYDALAEHLRARLGIDVKLLYLPFDAQVSGAVKRRAVNALVVKTWTLLRAEKSSGRGFERLADLPTVGGSDDLTGVFITRRDTPLSGLEDLDGKAVLMGPDGAYEKSFAARRALAAAGAGASRVEIIDGCVPLAAAVLERRADAGVVSSYVADFGGLALVGEAGDFKEIGRTAAVPFVTFAASAEMSPGLRARIRAALLEITGQKVPRGLYTTGFTPPAPWSPEELNP